MSRIRRLMRRSEKNRGADFLGTLLMKFKAPLKTLFPSTLFQKALLPPFGKPNESKILEAVRNLIPPKPFQKTGFLEVPITRIQGNHRRSIRQIIVFRKDFLVRPREVPGKHERECFLLGKIISEKLTLLAGSFKGLKR